MENEIEEEENHIDSYSLTHDERQEAIDYIKNINRKISKDYSSQTNETIEIESHFLDVYSFTHIFHHRKYIPRECLTIFMDLENMGNVNIHSIANTMNVSIWFVSKKSREEELCKLIAELQSNQIINIEEDIGYQHLKKKYDSCFWNREGPSVLK